MERPVGLRPGGPVWRTHCRRDDWVNGLVRQSGLGRPLPAYVPAAGWPGRPAASGLSGFEATDILAFGGELDSKATESASGRIGDARTGLSQRRAGNRLDSEPSSALPALIVNEIGSSRIAYLPADIDRCFTRDYWPDHRRLLVNMALWCLRDEVPLLVEGPGLLDCSLYQQDGRVVLHVVNHSGPSAWRAPADEFVPVGPLKVSVRVGAVADDIRLLCAGTIAKPELRGEWTIFTIPQVTDHEVAVIPVR